MVVGCSEAETLASRVPATAMVDLVQPPSGGGNGAWCGWRMMMGTLLGPERTTGCGVSRGLSFGARHDLVCHTVRESRPLLGVVFLGVWWWVEGCGLVVG